MKSSPKTSRRFRPQFELLEARDLPSGLFVGFEALLVSLIEPGDALAAPFASSRPPAAGGSAGAAGTSSIASGPLVGDAGHLSAPAATSGGAGAGVRVAQDTATPVLLSGTSASANKPAGHDTPGNWQVVRSPNPSTHGDTLTGVAAVSASSAWAVGFTDEIANAQSKTIVERWNGTRWSVVSSPNPGIDPNLNAGNHLNGVAAASANDVWAVGYYWKQSLNKTLIEHYDGTRWSVVASPNPGGSGRNNQLNAITTLSATDAWAVGYYENQIGATAPLAEHWNGTSWSVVSMPSQSTGNNLYAVSAVSSTNAWAVGSTYNAATQVWNTLTEHWDGTSWNIVNSPSPGNYNFNTLYAVTALSSNDVWAVGNFGTVGGAFQTLALHWNGTAWNVMPTPNQSLAQGATNILTGISAFGANDIWAVGWFRTPAGGFQHQSMTVHWDGSTWNTISSPTSGKAANLNAVATSGGSIWSVGAFSPNGNDIYTDLLIVPSTFVLQS